MSRPVRALIDEAALASNLARARQAAPGSRIMAVAKANAYGHGLAAVSGALGSADGFGVASLDEALALRESGLRHPITLLEGFFEPSELPLIVRHGLVTVVHHTSQLEMLERTRLRNPAQVWLKIDSGMHRLGFAPEAVRPVIQRLIDCPNVAKPLRYLSHLACADRHNGDWTRAQIDCFVDTVGAHTGERSLANSAAVLAWPDAHFDWVRPGIMLYGISPFGGTDASALGLDPVMTLGTRLIAVKQCRRGDPVGYGAEWRCPADMPVGIAAVGYGDGYPRHAPAGTPLLVNGERARLVGRVSMDMICVDLRAQPAAAVGDWVTLWGRGLPVEEIAEAAGTIAYELLCGVSPRVERCIEAQQQLSQAG